MVAQQVSSRRVSALRHLILKVKEMHLDGALPQESVDDTLPTLTVALSAT